MYTSSSSGRLPKTRSQWSDFYMDYNEEKKRKRRVLSESDEDNVVVIEEEEEEEAWRGVHDRSDEVVLESSNDDMKRFSFDDREETRGVVQEMSFFFNKGNGKKKKEEGDMTDGIEFWEDSDPKEKRDKGKEKENSPNRAFEHGLMKRVQMGERRAAVGWGSSSSSIHKRRKAPAEIALAQHGVKKMKGAFDASSINRRRKFTRMASEQSRHGLKQMKETERGKAKAALGGSSVKQRRINDDDDVVFLGESFSGSGIPLRTGSGSGSKVGSVGGRSPDIGTCDEVASSTTKTMFKEAVVGPEGDYSDASSLESRDSEEEEEECDDSEDADYKENAFSSSASSSSSGMEEEENGLSSSEESDEEGYHNRNMVKGQSEHAEKDPHVPKTKAASKKHRNKRKRNEKQKSKHTEKDSAQILQTKLHSENERHKQKWLDEKKHKSASEKQTSEKNYEIIRTKSAAASKRDKKKRKKIHEKKKKKHRSFDPENDEEIFKTTETSKKDEKEKHKKIDVKKKHKNLSSWKDAEFIKDKASSKKDRDKHGGGSDDDEEEIFKTTETSKKDEKEKHKKIDVQKKHKNLSSWKDAEFIKAKASSKKDRDKHRGGSDEKQHEKVDDAVEVADVLKTKEHSKKDKKKHKGVGEKKHKRIGEKQKSDVINGDKDAEIFKNEGTPQKDREKKHRGSDNKRHKKVGDAEKDTEILKTKASSKKEKNKHKGIDEEQHSTEHAEIDAEVLKTRLTSKKDRKKQKRIGEKHKEVDAEKDSETHKTKATPEKDKEKQKGVGEKQRGASSGEAADSGKQEGVASRLRSHSHSKSSKKEETQSSSSEGLGVGSSVGEDRQGGDDDDLEKENEEEKKDVVTQTTGTSERKQPRRNLDVKNILLNTMLENEVKFNETVPLAEENIPKQLPLKFTFYEDNEAPDKEEWEFEIDNLFADFQMGRLQSEIGSTAKPMVANKIADDAQPCWHPEGHLHILDEQIGILCKHCSVVFLESKHILPEFAKRPTSCRRNERGRFNHLYGEAEQSVGDMELDNMPRNDPTSSSSFHRAGTVWDLIPHHIKARMYLHQRQGLEFIWKNIAGELVLEKLQDLSSGGRGCIISHAPGTGKTGLTVVFLQSFMKLFPLCHPVVIAPRSMLLTWESEFKKWDVDIPFHNLNSRSLSGKEDVEEVHILRRKGKDMNRLLKLYSWAKGSGILGITYRLFEQLAGGTSCEEEDEKMRKILLKFPGLLVLDEGHTPRNEESLVWKALSRVETPRRIILSGTPFQNNFHELYNTLSLVCPEFTVGSTPGGIGSSDPKKKQQQQLTRKGIRKGRENWASITGSILNTENERNVEELRRLIGPLVHVHKGTILQEKLPGLMIWQVYLKLTPTQQKLQKMICSKNFMEQDNWMTLISVHPSLAPEGEARGVNELDPGEGVKTRFVAELVRASEGRGERVIVFSRLLEPLTLIRRQLLGEFPGWGDGREVLYMDGKIDAKYRQERIGSFNDPEGEAKVLLASTAACCEGINLVGASRIVLLDVVWNPSVTRQAISRAYRLGQTKVVHVYNLISSSFEANKYACQAKKDRMSELVFTADHPDHPDHHHDAVPADQDLILGAMLQDHSLSTMFHKIVRQPKNHQMLWPEFTN